MRQDLILNDNKDLTIKDGDFVIGDSKEQDAELILLSHQGDWKQSPLTGVNLRNDINSNLNVNSIARKIKIQLQNDGIYNINIELKDGQIILTDD